VWIELHDTLLDHRKVKRLSRAVTRGHVTVRGHLVTLWLSVLRHAPDGNLVDWDDADVEDYAEWDGAPGALVQALVEVGFLERDPAGKLTVHDWEEFATHIKAAKRKRNERERKRLEKEAKAAASRAVTGRHVTSQDGGRNSGPVTLNRTEPEPEPEPNQNRTEPEPTHGARAQQSAERFVKALTDAGLCVGTDISPTDRQRWWRLSEAAEIADYELTYAVGEASKAPRRKPVGFVLQVIEDQRASAAQKAREPPPPGRTAQSLKPPIDATTARWRAWEAVGKRCQVVGPLLRTEFDKLTTLVDDEQLEELCTRVVEDMNAGDDPQSAEWRHVVAAGGGVRIAS
jgi:hypothetical protein